MLQSSVVLLILVVGCSLANSQLTEFQEQFTEQSQSVETRLQELRAENNIVRQDLIRALLGDFANLTLELRQLTWKTWELVENHEAINDECFPVVKNLFGGLIGIGEMYTTYAAFNINFLMQYDAENRFHPWANLMSRENIRAISQTVQTLGRNQFLENMGDAVAELEDELEYYRNLWEGFHGLLQDEILAMEPFAKTVREEMAWWHENGMIWYTVFMDMIVADIHLFCDEELD